MKSQRILAALSVHALLALVVLSGHGLNAAEADTPPTGPFYDCVQPQFSHVGPQMVSVETQFHDELLADLDLAQLLCVPALKDGVGDPTAPLLECFEVIGGTDPDAFVNLKTQFGLFANVEVQSLGRLCVPATKTAQPPPPPPPWVPYYACYLAFANRVPVDVPVESPFRFTQPEVVVEGLQWLCVPALKNGTGDLGFPPLACFQTFGRIDPFTLFVQTQFGEDFVQGPQTMNGLLCVPAQKQTLPTPTPTITPIPRPTSTITPTPTPTAFEINGTPVVVGGLSVDLGPTGSSGGNASAVAAVIAGSTAAALALSGAAWYARRRWGR